MTLGLFRLGVCVWGLGVGGWGWGLGVGGWGWGLGVGGWGLGCDHLQGGMASMNAWAYTDEESTEAWRPTVVKGFIPADYVTIDDADVHVVQSHSDPSNFGHMIVDDLFR